MGNILAGKRGVNGSLGYPSFYETPLIRSNLIHLPLLEDSLGRHFAHYNACNSCFMNVVKGRLGLGSPINSGVACHIAAGREKMKGFFQGCCKFVSYCNEGMGRLSSLLRYLIKISVQFTCLVMERYRAPFELLRLMFCSVVDVHVLH